MIGLAMKAGKVKSGEFLTETEVKSGGACLVVLAGDASEATKKKFRNMCEFYQVPFACGDGRRICKRNPETFESNRRYGCIKEVVECQN